MFGLHPIILVNKCANISIQPLVFSYLFLNLLQIGSAAPGRPFEVVLNVHSKRKTPSVVSFADDIREFGEAALGNDIKNDNINNTG